LTLIRSVVAVIIYCVVFALLVGAYYALDSCKAELFGVLVVIFLPFLVTFQSLLILIWLDLI
jgi:hypothetical protein